MLSNEAVYGIDHSLNVLFVTPSLVHERLSGFQCLVHCRRGKERPKLSLASDVLGDRHMAPDDRINF